MSNALYARIPPIAAFARSGAGRRPWRAARQRILHNQRGFVLDRAIQQGTENVVICRLRFRPTAWSRPGDVPVTHPDAAAERQGPQQRAATSDGS
jgi:hypothetical protein